MSEKDEANLLAIFDSICKIKKFIKNKLRMQLHFIKMKRLLMMF